MSARGTQLAIELGSNHITVVEGEVGSGGLRLTRWAHWDRPAGQAADPVTLGEWLKGKLHANGFEATRAVVGLERHEVVLKRLTLPVATGGMGELVGMVQLQMTRQLPIASDEAVVDFVVIEHGATTSESGSGCVVLATALPPERIAEVQAFVRAAGLKLDRVGLKTAGAAALVAAHSGRGDTVTLGIALDQDAAEYFVIEGGHLVFSRRAEGSSHAGPAAGQEASDAELASRRIATEAKRTWMSYRSQPESQQVTGCVVLSESPDAEAAAAACAEALEMPCSVLRLPTSVERAPELAEGEHPLSAGALMLAGMLLERTTRRQVLDLAHPRRAPDQRQRARILAMAASLGLVLVVGGLMTASRLTLSRLDAEIAELQTQRDDLISERERAWRSSARLEHAERWAATSPQWLEHLAVMGELMPTADRALVQTVRAQSTPVLTYLAKGRGDYDQKKWSSGAEVRLSISGRAVDARAVEQVRDSFVRDSRYTVAPVGQDGAGVKDDRYPQAFGMDLTTGELAPLSDARPSTPTQREAGSPGGGR